MYLYWQGLVIYGLSDWAQIQHDTILPYAPAKAHSAHNPFCYLPSNQGPLFSSHSAQRLGIYLLIFMVVRLLWGGWWWNPVPTQEFFYAIAELGVYFLSNHPSPFHPYNATWVTAKTNLFCTTRDIHTINIQSPSQGYNIFMPMYHDKNRFTNTPYPILCTQFQALILPCNLHQAQFKSRKLFSNLQKTSSPNTYPHSTF